MTFKKYKPTLGDIKAKEYEERNRIMLENKIGPQPQLYHELCSKCKPFKKYATTRLVKEGEHICSVCGGQIS